jgi:hypothetical protein
MINISIYFIITSTVIIYQYSLLSAVSHHYKLPRSAINLANLIIDSSTSTHIPGALRASTLLSF